MLPQGDEDQRNVNQQTLDWYLKSFPRSPTLTQEEEIALARNAKRGDQNARERLISANLALVVHVIFREFQGWFRLFEPGDLIQEGNIGLIEAVRHFDPDRGNRFSTYAWKSIRQRVDRFVKTYGSAPGIYVPPNSAYLLIEMRRAITARGGVERNLQVSRDFGVKQKTLEIALDGLPRVCSLQDPAFRSDDGEGQILEDTIASPSDESQIGELPELSSTLKVIREILEEETRRCGDNVNLVIDCLIAITNGGTQSDIAKRYGVSRQRVSQLLGYARDILREHPKLLKLLNS